MFSKYREIRVDSERKTIKQAMDDDKKFWIADAENGFKLGKLVDIATDSWTIQPFDTPGKVCSILYVNCFAFEL